MTAGAGRASRSASTPAGALGAVTFLAARALALFPCFLYTALVTTLLSGLAVTPESGLFPLLAVLALLPTAAATAVAARLERERTAGAALAPAQGVPQLSPGEPRGLGTALIGFHQKFEQSPGAD